MNCYTTSGCSTDKKYPVLYLLHSIGSDDTEWQHVWNVDSNAHDPTHWRNNLYHFMQLIFR